MKFPATMSPSMSFPSTATTNGSPLTMTHKVPLLACFALSMMPETSFSPGFSAALVSAAFPPVVEPVVVDAGEIFVSASFAARSLARCG